LIFAGAFLAVFTALVAIDVTCFFALVAEAARDLVAVGLVTFLEVFLVVFLDCFATIFGGAGFLPAGFFVVFLVDFVLLGELVALANVAPVN
jgi:hypothetical protein